MHSARAGRRFVAVIAIFCAATWLAFRDEVLGPVLVSIRALTAELGLQSIRVTGLDAVREGTALYHSSGFAIEISRGCTALVGASLIAVGIAAYPAATAAKLRGFLVCVPAFLTLNLMRITHLYYLGVTDSDWFHVAHESVWQSVMAASVLVLWFGWVRWAERPLDVVQDR